MYSCVLARQNSYQGSAIFSKQSHSFPQISFYQFNKEPSIVFGGDDEYEHVWYLLEEKHTWCVCVGPLGVDLDSLLRP